MRIRLPGAGEQGVAIRFIGCRIITIDAKPDAVGFYEKFSICKAITDPKKIPGRDTVHTLSEFTGNE